MVPDPIACVYLRTGQFASHKKVIYISNYHWYCSFGTYIVQILTLPQWLPAGNGPIFVIKCQLQFLLMLLQGIMEFVVIIQFLNTCIFVSIIWIFYLQQVWINCFNVYRDFKSIIIEKYNNCTQMIWMLWYSWIWLYLQHDLYIIM